MSELLDEARKFAASIGEYGLTVTEWAAGRLVPRLIAEVERMTKHFSDFESAAARISMGQESLPIEMVRKRFTSEEYDQLSPHLEPNVRSRLEASRQPDGSVVVWTATVTVAEGEMQMKLICGAQTFESLVERMSVMLNESHPEQFNPTVQA